MSATESLATVRIERVTPAEPLPPRLAELVLERPAAGGEWSDPSLEVSGRIAGKAGAPACVEVVRAGRVLRRLPVHALARTHPRAPGERAEARACSFAGVVTTLGLPADFRLELVAVFEDGERVRVAALEGWRRPLRTAFEPTLRPLLVTTLDRLAPPEVMGLLAAHPQVVTLQRHPYECGTARYWLRALARLAQPALGPADADAAQQVVREPRPGAGLYVDRVAELCLRNVDSWYLELAHHQVKERPRYFAEKLAPGPLLDLARELYADAREVFVVRDLRDWVSAGLPGGRPRGAGLTAAPEGEPAEEVVRRHAAGAAELEAEWQARRHAAHLLRYEDLAADPAAAVRALLEHLELDAGRAAVGSLLAAWRAESRSHRPFQAGSREPLGRWRHALAPGHREIVARALSGPLRAFGYAAPRVPEGRSRALGGAAAGRLEER